jgi:hypothetical protein
MRDYGEKLMAMQKTGIKYKIGYLLNCPYCFSHWITAALNLLLWAISLPFITEPFICFLLAVITIPTNARVSAILRDNTLPPLTFNPTNNSEEIDMEGNPIIIPVTETTETDETPKDKTPSEFKAELLAALKPEENNTEDTDEETVEEIPTA